MYDGDSSLASPTRVKNTHGQIRRACSTEVPAYLHTESDLDVLVSTMCVTRIRACRTMLTTPCVDNQPQSTAIHCASTTKMNQTLHQLPQGPRAGKCNLIRKAYIQNASDGKKPYSVDIYIMCRLISAPFNAVFVNSFCL